jgi:hypothetical protein
LAVELLLDRHALPGAVHQPLANAPPKQQSSRSTIRRERALRHLAVDELGRNRRRLEVLDGGVRAREVERAVFVLQPVAGDVEQEQVVAAAVAKELRELAANDVVGLVQRDADAEVADLRIAEHPR